MFRVKGATVCMPHQVKTQQSSPPRLQASLQCHTERASQADIAANVRKLFGMPAVGVDVAVVEMGTPRLQGWRLSVKRRWIRISCLGA